MRRSRNRWEIGELARIWTTLIATVHQTMIDIRSAVKFALKRVVIESSHSIILNPSMTRSGQQANPIAGSSDRLACDDELAEKSENQEREHRQPVLHGVFATLFL
jgi:hypothetical protein